MAALSILTPAQGALAALGDRTLARAEQSRTARRPPAWIGIDTCHDEEVLDHRLCPRVKLLGMRVLPRG